MKISRLKTFCLTILLISTVWMADLAWSHPLPLFQEPLILAQTAEATPPSTTIPASEQATESQTPPVREETRSSRPQQPASGEQSAITDQPRRTPPSAERSQPSKPSNTDTFGAFDRALYGS